MRSWQPSPNDLHSDLNRLLDLTVGALLLGVRSRESQCEEHVLRALTEQQKRAPGDRLALLHPFLFRFHNDYAEQESELIVPLSALFNDVLPRISESRRRARQAEAMFGLRIDISPPDLA